MKSENLNKNTESGNDFNCESSIADSCDSVFEPVFPCRSNTEIKVALESLLHSPKVHIEVTGGIVRHNVW